MDAVQIRQGDVLLVPVADRPPKSAKLMPVAILAEGETTGHAHKLIGVEGVLVWDNMVWVVGEEPGRLQHEDHDPVPASVVVPGQAYAVVLQREQTVAGRWEPVRD